MLTGSLMCAWTLCSPLTGCAGTKVWFYELLGALDLSRAKGAAECQRPELASMTWLASATRERLMTTSERQHQGGNRCSSKCGSRRAAKLA